MKNEQIILHMLEKIRHKDPFRSIWAHMEKKYVGSCRERLPNWDQYYRALPGAYQEIIITASLTFK